jgi:transcriptional regulator with XRE-family HTH domain
MKTEKNLQIELGKKLRSLRINAGMSQDKLAELAGMKQPMINRFETGERGMRVSHAMALAPALSIVAADLLPPGIGVPVQQVTAHTAQGIAVPNMPLHDLIEDRARKDGAYAIAFALLKLANVLSQVADPSADSSG